MSVAISTLSGTENGHPVVVKPFRLRRPLHRLKSVRQSEGVSRRTVARRLGISPGQVAEQEQEDRDMPLSALYAWQEVLGVPVTELLAESDEPLSTPVMRRAQFLRVMRTVKTILERSKQVSIRRMAQVLADQLTEIMPELEHVGPWPAVGQRRTSRELGQAALRRLSAAFFKDLDE